MYEEQGEGKIAVIIGGLPRFNFGNCLNSPKLVVEAWLVEAWLVEAWLVEAWFAALDINHKLEFFRFFTSE